ncbi:MAG: hypothetical protein ACI8VC_000067 [Candidatus Endobugula sp.]|jgi:hypothetical protein
MLRTILSRLQSPFYLIVLSTLMLGCYSAPIDQYANNKPILDAQVFFTGALSAHGIVKDRSGNVIRYFNAELQGSWSNGKGLLKERFVFDDGEIQFRHWQLTPNAGKKTNIQTYVGRAEDVVGDGEVQVTGNAMFIRYTLNIPYGDSTIDINVDDRMYLVSEKVLINESTLKKWGLNVGEIILTIIKK